MATSYVENMKKWMRIVFRDPLSWLKISGCFLLLALPVVTVGAAWGFALSLAAETIQGNTIRFLPASRRFVQSPAFPKALVAGLMDCVLVVAIGFSARIIFTGEQSYPVRFLYASCFWFDLLLFISGLYRYPLLLRAQKIPYLELVGKSIAFTMKNLKQTFLLCMVLITVCVLSVLIGITLFVFLPGAAALLVMLFVSDNLKSLGVKV